MLRRSLLIFTCVVFLFAGMGMAYAQQNITASLKAYPASYSGKCPAKITFKGIITVKKPGKVQYKFIRSDGALAPIDTLIFKKPGTKPVSTTWTIGKNYSGWKAIKVLYPQEVESNKAKFKILCKGSALQKDLSIRITKCPRLVKQGQNLGAKFQVTGKSTFPTALKSIAVDIVLTSKRTYPTPAPYAVYSPNYSDGVLLKGGREHISFKGPGTVKVKLNGTNTIPANTPPGIYYLGAVIDAGNKVKEGNERNNVSFCRIKVVSSTVARPDLGMYGFLKIGKKKRQVKWGNSIVLTPRDATLISKGKPAFEIYYSYREYNGVAASGFKNKIFFNGKLRGQQTKLSVGPKQIKNVHTQAYLGPENGKLQIKIDADNEVNESREDNNFHFYVNLQFKGF